MVDISMKELLEAGVHFGHQTRRWNPKMKKYIFGSRNGIYIIDLQKTMKLFRETAEFVSDMAAKGKTILFVGTKRQAQEAVESVGQVGIPFVNQRWLGGTLTNFHTIKRSIDKLNELERMLESDEIDYLSKKDRFGLERKRNKLMKLFRGIKDLNALPDALFVIDPRREKIAVQEARIMNIPVIAVVDTNCDPDVIDYVIPGNDDAIRAINLFVNKMVQAIQEGRAMVGADVQVEAEPAEAEAVEAQPEEKPATSKVGKTPAGEEPKAPAKAKKVTAEEKVEAPAKAKKAADKDEAQASVKAKKAAPTQKKAAAAADAGEEEKAAPKKKAASRKAKPKAETTEETKEADAAEVQEEK